MTNGLAKVHRRNVLLGVTLDCKVEAVYTSLISYA